MVEPILTAICGSSSLGFLLLTFTSLPTSLPGGGESFPEIVFFLPSNLQLRARGVYRQLSRIQLQVLQRLLAGWTEIIAYSPWCIIFIVSRLNASCGETGYQREFFMLKIAILVREETTAKCTGKGCLRSFFAKKDSFAIYRNREVELIGFFHSGGDLEYKLAKMKEAGVQVIHLSTCIRAKYSGYDELARKIAQDFDVVGYTHGSCNGKSRTTVSLTGKYIDV